MLAVNFRSWRVMTSSAQYVDDSEGELRVSRSTVVARPCGP